MGETLPLPSCGYRPDIDGLRALAIIPVLLYHAGLGCPGGYIGVDIFFVISGYLITALILRDLEQGTFSLADFWERRVRRIFPALTACVAVTLLAGWFLLLPRDLESLGDSAVAQGVMGANFYFWQTTNYFGGENLTKPLLHTWSLAVEEQFYILLPLALLGLFACQIRKRKLIASLLAILWLASFAISVWGIHHQPYATFFLLPTRAWELLCGGLIAVIPLRKHLPAWLTEATSGIGLLAILLPIFSYTENTPFPSWAALPPCLGTAAIIWANQHNTSLTARTLSLAPLRWIGIISYSLYLWHWPLLAFSDYWKTDTFAIHTRWALVSLAFIFAWLSWKWIEIPFRRKQICRTRKSIFTAAALTSVTLISTGAWFSIAHGLPARLPESVRTLIQENDERQKARLSASDPANGLSIKKIQSGKLPTLGKAVSEKPHFLVWGDSHAKVQLSLFDELAKKRKISGHAITVYGTPPLVSEKTQDRFAEAVLQHIANTQIEDVFLVGYWSLYQKNLGAYKLEQNLLKTITSIEDAGARVTVLQGVPAHRSDVLRLLIRDRFPGWPGTIVTSGSKTHHRETNAAIYRAAARSRATRYIDPSPVLWDEKSSAFILTIDGKPLYYDSNHLSRTGVEYTWKPLLVPLFDEMISTP